MSTVNDILTIKGTQVHTIPAGCSVLESVRRMHDLGVGCLVVIGEDGALIGMITERDVLKKLALDAADLSQVTVAEVMTKRVAVCGCDDQIDAVRSIMKNQRVRQVPVVDEDRQLLGIVSLGDVNAFMIREDAREILHLHDYIEGRVR